MSTIVTRGPDARTVDQIVRRIVETAAPERVILFGSAARGEMGPDSDLDFLVVKECDDELAEARKIRRELEGVAVGTPKEIIVVTPGYLAQHKDTIGYIYRPALREGKALYAR
jgi:predicted nucleotidyltransferase